MKAEKITDYTERIYAYALKRTFSDDEAAELAQEILLTAVSELDKLRDESRFEPWLFGIASNVTKRFRRYMGKQRAMYAYDVSAEEICENMCEETNNELYDTLRSKIAMLSKIYREIIILYYYDGLSTKQIAERLEIPAGTVSWRLSEARRKLKKECNDMNEAALRPVKMNIDIYGEGNYNGETIPFPNEYIDDALSQNILYHCYEKEKSVEELSKLCGTPAYYIEERIDNLVKRCAVIQPSKGKYQTDFIIWTDKYGKYCEENAEAALAPIMDKLTDGLEKLYEQAAGIDFYRAGKSEDELKFLYGTMAFDYLSRKYSNIEYPRRPINYDGNRWRYIANMESGKYHRTNIGHQCSSNRNSGGTYKHEVFGIWNAGFSFRNMMYDLYINVCEDILKYGKTDAEAIAAEAISKGFIIRRENGELFVTVPAFTKEQKSRFDEITDDIFRPLMPEYTELVKRFITGYKNLFPKHLEEDAQRMCQGFFMEFYDTVLHYSLKNGILKAPAAGSICDVLIQWK